MKVDVVNLTWFQKVLHHVARLVGLSPFTVKNNEIRPVTVLGKAYSLTFIVLTVTNVYSHERNKSYGTNNDSSTNLVTLILAAFYCASTVSSSYIFSFKSEKIIEVINRISAAEEDLKMLGMEKRQRGYLKIITINVFVMAMKIIEFAINPSTLEGLDGMRYGIFWIVFIMTLLHTTNMILIFVHTMTRIGRCFESLNEKLWEISGPYHAALSSEKQQASLIFVLARSQTTVSDQDSTDVRLTTEDIRKMRKLHHELGSLVNTTTDLFATPIVLLIGYFFSCSLFYCYTVYGTVSSSEFLSIDTTILVSLFRTLVPAAMVLVLKLMLIAHACSSTCDAGNATAVKIHEVWNKFHPEKLRDELFMFSVQQLRNPVTATAFGFFDLGYSYVQKILCAVVAYLAIMIQMNDPSSRNNSARE